jgi:hypothetical protein
VPPRRSCSAAPAPLGRQWSAPSNPLDLVDLLLDRMKDRPHLDEAQGDGLVLLA